MLSQLVYVSNRAVDCDESQIRDILDASIKNNPILGITGILLYTEDKFIQLIEGDSIALKKLYDKIKMDKRHRNCVMIAFNEIAEKSFPNWHMGTKKIRKEAISYATEIKENEREHFKKILTNTVDSQHEVINTLKKFFEKLPDQESVYRS